MLTPTSEAAPLVEQKDSPLATAELELGGMHCSACATPDPEGTHRLPAVASAAVNLATTRAFVAYDPARSITEELCRCRYRRRATRRHP